MIARIVLRMVARIAPRRRLCACRYGRHRRCLLSTHARIPALSGGKARIAEWHHRDGCVKLLWRRSRSRAHVTNAAACELRQYLAGSVRRWRLNRRAIGAARQDAILDLLIGMEFAGQEPADHAQCPQLDWRLRPRSCPMKLKTAVRSAPCGSGPMTSIRTIFSGANFVGRSK
jgi:hypothetical protein